MNAWSSRPAPGSRTPDPLPIETEMAQALALHQRGQAAQALALYRRVLTREPQHFEALHLGALALHQTGNVTEAEHWLHRALRLRPTHAPSHGNLGLVLEALGKVPEAAAAYEAALANGLDHMSVLLAHARLCGRLGRHGQAADSLGRAVSAQPGVAALLREWGFALHAAQRHGQARVAFERALALDGGDAERYRFGQYLLHLGDLAAGWPALAARWRLTEHAHELARFPQPAWPGASAAPGPLLVWGEQGLGDQILFLGLLAELQEREGDVAVAVEERLLPLVRRSFPGVEAVPLHAPKLALPARAQVPMSGLGAVLRPDWAAFERTRRAYLQADAPRSADLRRRLVPAGQRLCGLSWRSANELQAGWRDVPLAAWGPVLRREGWCFVDLQFGDTAAERAHAEQTLGLRLQHVDDVDTQRDIDGVAALAAACDVVVTVANTTAHVAAALGRPVLQLLPRTHGRLWYWHEGRDDSPWYPSLRQFTQSETGRWDDVLRRVAAALDAL